MNGRADAIRTMLAHANFKYDDQRITSEEFALLRQRNGLPLGSMPVWEEDGYMVCQSSAILRMLGIRCGYYSEDPMICWAIDSLIDFHEGLQADFARYISPALKGEDLNEDASEWFHSYWSNVISVC